MSKAFTIILLGMMVAGCDPRPPPDIITDLGTYVYLNNTSGGFTLSNINALENTFINDLVSRGWDKREMLEGFENTSVYMSDKAIPCVSEGIDGNCNGIENRGTIHVWDNPNPDTFPNGCPAATAYIHELGHMLHGSTHKGNEDPKHADPALWPQAPIKPDATAEDLGAVTYTYSQYISECAR